MTITALYAVDGSVGAPRLTAALTGGWPDHRRALLVEADPSGGVLGTLNDLEDYPSADSLAEATRHNSDTIDVWRHTQPLPTGGRVLHDPNGSNHDDLSEVISDWAHAQGVDLIVACGRFIIGSQSQWLRRADRVALFANPTSEQLATTVRAANDIRSRVEHLWIVAVDRIEPTSDASPGRFPDVRYVSEWLPAETPAPTRTAPALRQLSCPLDIASLPDLINALATSDRPTRSP